MKHQAHLTSRKNCKANKNSSRSWYRYESEATKHNESGEKKLEKKREELRVKVEMLVSSLFGKKSKKEKKAAVERIVDEMMSAQENQEVEVTHVYTRASETPRTPETKVVHVYERHHNHAPVSSYSHRGGESLASGRGDTWTCAPGTHGCCCPCTMPGQSGLS